MVLGLIPGPVKGVVRQALRLRRLAIERLKLTGRHMANLARDTSRVTTAWMDSYKTPFAFERDWKWLRLEVDLQTRLFVEQVLWDRGGVWKAMVTGFGPSELDKGLGGRRGGVRISQEVIDAVNRASRRPYVAKRGKGQKKKKYTY